VRAGGWRRARSARWVSSLAGKRTIPFHLPAALTAQLLARLFAAALLATTIATAIATAIAAISIAVVFMAAGPTYIPSSPSTATTILRSLRSSAQSS
jgi:hypothetical protein